MHFSSIGGTGYAVFLRRNLISVRRNTLLCDVIGYCLDLMNKRCAGIHKLGDVIGYCLDLMISPFLRENNRNEEEEEVVEEVE